MRFMIKKIIKRFLCNHHYEIVFRKDLQGGYYKKCSKCKKVK